MRHGVCPIGAGLVGAARVQGIRVGAPIAYPCAGAKRLLVRLVIAGIVSQKDLSLQRHM